MKDLYLRLISDQLFKTITLHSNIHVLYQQRNFTIIYSLQEKEIITKSTSRVQS